jgi:hypothetical protein
MLRDKRINAMRAAVLAAAWAVPAVLFAADIRPIFRAGADVGGDVLVTATFTDGSTQKIRANQGVSIGGGASFVNEAKDLEVEVALSYKFALINANNGDINWTRIPLDALVFYRWQKFRLGGGLTYHINPKLDGSGVVGGLNVKFDNALGGILQADWRITEKINLGLRYTSVKYEAQAPAAGSAKTDGFGAAFSYRF